MKKNIFRFIFISIFILGIILTVGYFLVSDFFQKNELISMGGQKFQVEIADDSKKRTLGLGERESLCQECAMVFVFSEKAKHSFWMKGMRFPLDIIWFNSDDGKIAHIEKNIPADSQKIYIPIFESDRVLEINGGMAEKLNIQTGDTILVEK